MEKLTDGYYLSTYITIDRLSNIYDVKMINRHDQNIALWKKESEVISLVHYWEVERLTERKHHCYAWYDKEQFYGVMNDILSRYDISMNDINAVWGTMGIDKNFNFENSSLYTYHGLCHLFSALLLETEVFYNETIIAFDLDFASDYETENRESREKAGCYEHVGCVSVKGEITYFPIESPAALWASAAARHNMEEGTLMALCSATKCQFKESCFDYRKNITGCERVVYNSFFDSIDRLTEDEFRECAMGYDEGFSIEDNKISAAMKLVQAYSKYLMDCQVGSILKKFDLNAEDCCLAVSGGFGLNCPTNSYLMNKYRFKCFQAPPCINDSGQALGCGLYEFYKTGEKIRFSFGHNAFKGNDVALTDKVITQLQDSEYVLSISGFDAEIAVQDIIEGPVVWMEGRAEIGPRALGHRSIIASPADIKIKDQMNTIKQRQFWRPVAPMVLEEMVDEYFMNGYTSEFMLNVFNVRPDKLEVIPAIAHIDGTARVQTVSGNLGYISQLLEQFYKKTGIPVICNTSLNDRGEAIIDDPLRAVEFAIEKKINVVYINGNRIAINQEAKYRGEWKNRLPYVSLERPDKEELKLRLNPYKLSEDIICRICKSAKYRKEFNLTDKNDLDKIKKIWKDYIVE